jgi:hypothetical protein
MNAVTDALASHGIRSDFLCGVDVDGDREVYTVKNGRVSALLEVVNGTLDEMRAAHALRVFKDACSATDTARQAAEDAKHVEDTKQKIQRKLNIMKEQIGVFDWHGRRARGERLQSYLADMRERLSAAFGRDDVDALLESAAQEQNTVQSDIRVIRQTLKLTEPTPTQMLRNDALRVLRLSEPFDVQALKSSYRTLCRTAHPDRGGSKDQFQRVQNAYAMLLQSLEGESQAAAPAPTPVLGKRRSDDPSSVSSKKRALNSVERHAATPAVVSAVPKTTSNGPPKKLSPKPFNTDAPKKIIPKPGVIKKIIPKPNVSAAKNIIPKPVAASVEADDGAGVFDLITNPREYHNLRRQPTLEGKTDDFRRAVSDTMQLWEFDESTSNPYRGPITDEEREKKLINTIETMSQKWIREGRDVVM